MPIKLGTRPSPLALKQAQRVKLLLQQHDSHLDIEIIPIKSEGDIKVSQPLRELGGKGVFIKTLEQALIEKKIDCAIHSFKDVTSHLAEGTELSFFLNEDGNRDCVISSRQFPNDFVLNHSSSCLIATSSIRRVKLLEHWYPNIQTKDIRGNVETRVNHCHNGFADAVLLSEAGVRRLGLSDQVSQYLDPFAFVPAPGQGIMTAQVRSDDQQMKTLFQGVQQERDKFLGRAYYLFMKTVGLDCQFPIGLYLSLADKKVEGAVFWADIKGKLARHETFSCDAMACRQFLFDLGVKINKECK